MEKIKQMEEQLSSMIQVQLCNPEKVDAEELGEVVDMLKDLAEFCYYKKVTEAMEEGSKEKEKYLPYEKSYKYNPYRDIDIEDGRMYYTEPSMRGMKRDPWRTDDAGARPTSGDRYPMQPYRDPREGKSPVMRKYYMESKELHHGKEMQMKELEEYMKELSTDVTEMIQDATPEEKQILKQKMTQLANMIQ